MKCVKQWQPEAVNSPTFVKGPGLDTDVQSWTGVPAFSSFFMFAIPSFTTTTARLAQMGLNVTGKMLVARGSKQEAYSLCHSDVYLNPFLVHLNSFILHPPSPQGAWASTPFIAFITCTIY